MAETLSSLLRYCTLKVQHPAGHGTGIFVAPGLILTCAHVIQDACSEGDRGQIQVSWSKQLYPARIKTALMGLYPDLALLQVPFTRHPCAFLAEEVHPFDRLYCYGYSDISPDGDSATFECEGWAQESAL